MSKECRRPYPNANEERKQKRDHGEGTSAVGLPGDHSLAAVSTADYAPAPRFLSYNVPDDTHSIFPGQGFSGA